MVKRAYELWEDLDASTDQTLYVETGALWMHRGDDAYVRSSLPILKELGFAVDKLSVEDAARRYPQIDFRGVQSVWLERRAGALSARRACIAVRDAFQKAGGSYRTAHVEPGPIVNGSLPPLRLADGSRIDADAYVFACGPWLGRLFPEVLGDAIHPTRQEVFYFGRRAAPSAISPAACRSGSISASASSTASPTSTAAASRSPTTRAASRSIPPAPTARPARKPSPARASCLPNASLSLPRRRCSNRESANTRTAPTATSSSTAIPRPRTSGSSAEAPATASSCSPAVGEIAAARILMGKEVPALFRLERLRDTTKPTTQFDTKN